MDKIKKNVTVCLWCTSNFKSQSRTNLYCIMSLQSAFAYEVASHAYTIMDTPPCQFCACVCALRHVNGASGEGEGRVDESAQTVVGAMSPTQSEPHREEAVGNGVSKNGQFSLVPELQCYSEHVCTSYVHVQCSQRRQQIFGKFGFMRITFV